MTGTISTGSREQIKTKLISHTFGRYEVTVEVTLDNKFIGIAEIKLNKDFRSYIQKIASTKVLDVEEYYKDV